MRGFPPIQIFLLCLAFVVLAVPLAHLTGNAQAKPAAKAPEIESKEVKALLRLRYAHKPATLSVKIADKELVTTLDASPFEIKSTLPSSEGTDVFLTATWPDNTPDTAITIELEPDGLDSRSETRWSSGGSLDEVITFSWK